jgi:SOS-response transcriptional repressor LexA
VKSNKAVAMPGNGEAPASCGSGESFALMVLGDSMEPEFTDGEIIVIEPDGIAADGSYVLAMHDGEWTFRQLMRRGNGWVLAALNPDYPTIALTDLGAVKGVVIQKAAAGRRRSKRYI